MSRRIITSVSDDIHFRCKCDAQELHLSLSSYVSMLLRQRHGLLSLMLPPPVITELPMQAKKADYNFFDL